MEDKHWYLYVVDHHEGPYTAKEIQNLVKNGQALSSSFVWKEGLTDWVMMEDVKEFGNISGSSGDGWGPFSFILDKFKKNKPSTKELAASSLLDDVSPSASVFCVNSKKQFSGPYSIKVLSKKLNSGEFSLNDSVWKEGWSGFVPISSIPLLSKEYKPSVKAMGSSALNSNQFSIVGNGKSSSKRAKILFIFLFIILSLYQATAKHLLDPVYDLVGIKNKVTELALDPLPLDKAVSALSGVLTLAEPYLEPALNELPDSIKNYLPLAKVPEGVAENKVEEFKSVLRSGLNSGALVSASLVGSEVQKPKFIIATNLPNGTILEARLVGKTGTLLNVQAFEKKTKIEVVDKIAKTLSFSFEGVKPLPKGEYYLQVFEDAQQSDVVSQALAALPKKQISELGLEKVAFLTDFFFLGGPKDEDYTTRLAEYNKRYLEQQSLEIQELRQISNTIETIANESANFFGTNQKNKKAWTNYHKKYKGISDQLKTELNKTPLEIRKQTAIFTKAYELLFSIVDHSEQLHELQNQMVISGKPVPGIKETAGTLVQELNAIKSLLESSGSAKQ